MKNIRIITGKSEMCNSEASSGRKQNCINSIKYKGKKEKYKPQMAFSKGGHTTA